MDQWTERLSEYVDGELSSPERAALEQHLEGCFECKQLLGDLRVVAEEARALPDRAPSKDLWAGIASQIGAQAPVQLNDLKVISLADHKRAAARRRVSFTLPQLAAAAIVLMVMSGALVWSLIGTGAAPAAVAANDAARTTTVRSVSETAQSAQYSGAVGDLETALKANREQLDPVTVAIIEENLRTIDSAITEARAALERDPGNLYLNQHLENTMKKKLQLLRRANSLTGATS